MYDRHYKAVLTRKCGCPLVGHPFGGRGGGGGGEGVGAGGSLSRHMYYVTLVPSRPEQPAL